MLDLQFLKRLVDATAAYQTAADDVTAAYPGDAPFEQYKRVEAEVNAICAFFDALFGEGTAERIFKRSNDAHLYLNAMEEFGRGLQKADRAVGRRFR